MAGIKEAIEKVGWDLLNLEVNTIIRPGIQGKKMPAPGDALIDIATWYQAGLVSFGADVTGLDKKEPGGCDSFESLQSGASTKIKEIEDGAKTKGLSPEEQPDFLLLCRIRDMSEQIVKMMKGIENKGEFNADERVLIRKIWEVGLDEIAMQTVIQIDGDVVTRIEPQYAKSDDKSKVLREIHERSVTVSLAAWKELIGLVKDFFSGIVKLFLG